jgi:D-3-phosphoglycerate dehydrogenase
MTKPTVYIPEQIGIAGLALLQEHCRCLMPWESNPASPPPPPRELLAEADAVVVRLFTIGEADFARAPRIKVVAKHGVGIDNIDCAAATRRGVPVVWCPGASSNAVAEHALTLAFALARQIDTAIPMVKAGEFAQRDRLQGTELAGKTLGIIGLGRIGSRVALKAALGLGMNVLAYDPLLDRSQYEGPARFVDELSSLLQAADYVTLHVPLTNETRRMIDARTLAMLKPTARLINTSRGAVVDEVALAAALVAGQLAGAAIDVFETEPVPVDHPLCLAPHAILTPHMSASTAESWENVSRMAAEGVLEVLAGRQPAQVYNPEVFAAAKP